MQKNAIINVDDFGISSGTNKGIEKARWNGVLASGNIMPVGSPFLDAVRFVKRNKKL